MGMIGLTPDKAIGKITLRRNDGSYPEVVKVFAYDPRAGIVLVLLKYVDGALCLDKLSVLTELEAIDERRQYIDPVAIVTMRAFNVINRDDLVAVEKPGS